jgi:hypothetical protein
MTGNDNGETYQTYICIGQRIGQADGERLVSVMPPLTEEEIRDLEYAEIITPGGAAQIEEPGPACTVITVSSEQGDLPETRTRNSLKLGTRIAAVLTQLRDGDALFSTQLVPLIGQNNNPFNSNTQASN